MAVTNVGIEIALRTAIVPAMLVGALVGRDEGEFWHMSGAEIGKESARPAEADHLVEMMFLNTAEIYAAKHNPFV